MRYEDENFSIDSSSTTNNHSQWEFFRINDIKVDIQYFKVMLQPYEFLD